jgi:DNA-binding Xre family transcriptional regulator
MAKHIGTTFDSFLEEEGIKDAVDLLTFKKVLADEIQARMSKLKIGVQELADRMHTTRTPVYRLLDGNDAGVTLKTMAKAAEALDWRLAEMLVMVAHASGGARPAKQRRRA